MKTTLLSIRAKSSTIKDYRSIQNECDPININQELKTGATSLIVKMSSSEHKIGVIKAMSYVLGNVIGSGIFITTGAILQHTGSIGLALIIWIVCGILVLACALCYIELATSIPEPGADFAYLIFIGWNGIAFAFMWAQLFIAFPAGNAVVIKTFGRYITTGMDPIWNLNQWWKAECEQGLGILALVALTILNLYDIDSYAGRFQIFATICKLLSLAVIIITGFYLLIFKGWTENLVHPMENSNWKPSALVLAFYAGYWPYGGWDVLNYGTSEIKHPRRTIPLALISGLSLVTFIYIAINVAYCVVLTPGQITNSSAVAADFAQQTLGDFSYAIPFMVGILLIGSLNGSIFMGSRFIYAAARERQLPAFLSCINEETSSPRAAILWQMIVTIVISFFDVETLINYVVFLSWGQRVFTLVALLNIRYQKIPVAEGAIRVPIVLHVICLIASIVLVTIPFVEETIVTSIGVIIVTSGLIFYYLLVKSDNVPQCLSEWNNKMSMLTCRMLNCKIDIKEQHFQTLASEFRTIEESESRQTLRSRSSTIITNLDNEYRDNSLDEEHS